MRYSYQKSYRDSLMVEVQKVIKTIEEKPKKKVNFFIRFLNWLKSLFKL